jgi:hypothetical protein
MKDEIMFDNVCEDADKIIDEVFTVKKHEE